MRDLKKAAADLKAYMDKRSSLQEQLGGAPLEFRQRYRVWCLAECQEEFARDFRLLKMVRNNVVSGFLEYLKTIDSPGEQRNLVLALCKRFHWQELLGAEEQPQIERFVQFFTVPFQHSGGEMVSSLRVSSDQLALQDRYFQRRVSKNAVTQALREEARKLQGGPLGELILDRDSALWFERRLSTWFLVTAFDFSGSSQLRYCQTMYASSGGLEGTQISSGISILDWMGIMPKTTWSWLVPEDAPTVVASVHELCTHFLSAAETLLTGLVAGP